MTRRQLDKLIALGIIVNDGRTGLYHSTGNRYLVAPFLKHSSNTYNIYVYPPMEVLEYDYLMMETTVTDYNDAIKLGLGQWKLSYCTG